VIFTIKNLLAEVHNIFFRLCIVTPGVCQCTCTIMLMALFYQFHLLWLEKFLSYSCFISFQFYIVSFLHNPQPPFCCRSLVLPLLFKIVCEDTWFSLFIGMSYPTYIFATQYQNWLDAHGFICILYSSIFALHVSGVICTHPQEHKLQSTAIGMRSGYGRLIHWSRYWLRHPHTFSTVKFVLKV
jgi:hypothetical protein